MDFKVINDIKVNPVRIKGGWNSDSKMFNWKYSNTFVCAKKASGKTNTIFRMIKEYIKMYKDLVIIIFSSTVKRDPTWVYITEYLNKRKKEFMTFTSIQDDDALEDLSKYLENEENNYIKYIAIFDDLSTELKSKQIDFLLKRNKNFQLNIIISSQYVADLPPTSRTQIDLWLLFKGHDKDKLEMIYKSADLNVTFEKFLELYYYATQDKYNFLYVDARLNQFRKNFNVLITPTQENIFH